MRPGTVLRQTMVGPAMAAVCQGRGARVLDLAGYDGGATAVLRAQGAQVVVLDLDQSGLRRAQSDGLFAVRASAAALPFGDGAFDMVVCLDMLYALPEHLEAPMMLEIRRVLKAGGYLIISAVSDAFALPFCNTKRVFQSWQMRPGYRLDQLQEFVRCAGAEITEHRRFYGWTTRFFYALFYYWNIPSRGYHLKARLWQRIVRLERRWCPAPRAHLLIARTAKGADDPGRGRPEQADACCSTAGSNAGTTLGEP